ncbi:MAG: hypothetical protein Q9202_001603 [Teloschistes flavicans]
MSLTIVPPTSHPHTTTNLSASSSTKGAPSAPGIHDTLRSSLNPSPSTTTTTQRPTSTHPLESRLLAWQSTQDSLKMTALRRNFGIAEPVRRGMELKICREGEWRPHVLGPSAGVSGDVLAGRDTEIAWEDVFTGAEEVGGRGEGAGDVHVEMEKRLGMDW